MIDVKSHKMSWSTPPVTPVLVVCYPDGAGMACLLGGVTGKDRSL